MIICSYSTPPYCGLQSSLGTPSRTRAEKRHQDGDNTPEAKRPRVYLDTPTRAAVRSLQPAASQRSPLVAVSVMSTVY